MFEPRMRARDKQLSCSRADGPKQREVQRAHNGPALRPMLHTTFVRVSKPAQECTEMSLLSAHQTKAQKAALGVSWENLAKSRSKL